MRWHPSPNWNPRPDGALVDTLILHYTGMPNADAALARLCDPGAEVSAHYMIDEGGDVLRGFPADGSESLNEFAVRKTGVDQDAGGTGL